MCFNRSTNYTQKQNLEEQIKSKSYKNKENLKKINEFVIKDLNPILKNSYTYSKTPIVTIGDRKATQKNRINYRKKKISEP